MGMLLLPERVLVATCSVSDVPGHSVVHLMTVCMVNAHTIGVQ